jgi:hypothetical protein
MKRLTPRWFTVAVLGVASSMLISCGQKGKKPSSHEAATTNTESVPGKIPAPPAGFVVLDSTASNNLLPNFGTNNSKEAEVEMDTLSLSELTSNYLTTASLVVDHAVRLREVEEKLEGETFLSATNTQVTVAHTTLGNFFVVYKKAEPYLNGHKVRIEIGNPYAIDFVGLKIWGNYGKDYKEFSQSFNSTVDFGAWNDFELILVPSSTEDVIGIRVNLSFDRVRMRNAGGVKD